MQQASLNPAPLMLPRSPSDMTTPERQAYLRELWDADIDPFVFVGVARRLGYVPGCRWDFDVGMPVLVPTFTLLH